MCAVLTCDFVVHGWGHCFQEVAVYDRCSMFLSQQCCMFFALAFPKKELNIRYSPVMKNSEKAESNQLHAHLNQVT